MGNIEDIPVRFESFITVLSTQLFLNKAVLPIVDCSGERIAELFIKMYIFN